MKKGRTTSLVFFIVVMFTIVSVFTGCGDTTSKKTLIPKVEEDVYIYDEDNIIDDDVEKELNKMLNELEEKTEAEFTVVSVESLHDRSIEDLANNLFNTMDIGKKGKDNGALLLISRSDERVRLKVGRGLEGCLNVSKCGRILDKYFIPYQDDDEYEKATEMTVKAVLNIIAKEYEIEIQGLEEELLEEDESKEEFPLSAFLVLIAVLFVISIIADILDKDNSSGGSSDEKNGGSKVGSSGDN